MLNKFLSIFFICIFLCSCSNKYEYVTVVNKVVKKKAKQLCQEENLTVRGGGGAMMNGISEVAISFNANRCVDLYEARRLFIHCMEEIKNSVNTTEFLYPYLKPCPLPLKAFDVDIFFTKDGRFINYPPLSTGNGGVSCVLQIESKIYYCSFNQNTQLLETYYEEPYETALEIVRQGKGK